AVIDSLATDFPHVEHPDAVLLDLLRLGRGYHEYRELRSFTGLQVLQLLLEQGQLGGGQRAGEIGDTRLELRDRLQRLREAQRYAQQRWQTPAGGQAPARGRLRSPPASHRVVGAGSTGERPGGVVPDGGATDGPPTGPPLGLDAPKSTVGAVATACSSVTVKFGFTWKSNIFAVRFVGKLRTLMLYWRTASM